MIDFRYHLVSLVSVFLALAVGIVLGAGPLEGSIGQTLTDQVDALRNDRDALRDDLASAETALQHREEFITAVTPALVDEQLGGRSVVLVTLPGAATNDLDSLTTALEGAGATVTGRVGVSTKWTDPGEQAARDELVTRLGADLDPLTDGVDPRTATLGDLLARAVVTDDIAEAGTFDDTAQTLLDGLQGAEVIVLDGDLSGRATEAVVVAPPVEAPADQTPAPTPDVTEETLGAWADLARRLDTGSDGSVVLGPASSAGAGGLVAVVRGDEELAAAVSSVDTAASAMGAVTTVFALQEQLRGASGAYGFGDGATAPLPELPSVAGEPTPTPSPTPTPGTGTTSSGPAATP